MKKHDRIVTRYYSNTYIARWRGKTASCTAGHRQAAEAVARKVLSAGTAHQIPFTLHPWGGGQFAVTPKKPTDTGWSRGLGEGV